ncbi:uncharacterized protein LOC127845487 isoform X2 [Dreissena polymorpha]|nr:uncharacterized protein LOC127845487 isoform X2 [Dreissena polymorpha]
MILDTLPTDDTIYEKLQTLSRCPIHPQVEIESYCKEHSSIICQYCIKDKHKMCGDIVDLAVFQNEHVGITQTLEEIRQKTELLRTEKDKESARFHTINTSIKQGICSYVQQIRDVADGVEKCLNEQHASLVSLLFDEWNQYEQNLTSTEIRLREYEHLSKIIGECGKSNDMRVLVWKICNLKIHSDVPDDLKSVVSKHIKLNTPSNACALLKALEKCTVVLASMAEIAMETGSDDVTSYEESTSVNPGFVGDCQISKFEKEVQVNEDMFEAQSKSHDIPLHISKFDKDVQVDESMFELQSKSHEIPFKISKFDKDVQVDESMFESQSRSHDVPLMEMKILPKIDKIKLQTDYGDECECNVVASDVLGDGRIIVLDQTNNEVKIFSVDLQLLSYMTVDDMPLDMCILEESQNGNFMIAICFETSSALNIFAYDGAFRETNTVDVENVEYILGIAMYRKHIVAITRSSESYSRYLNYTIQLIDPSTGHVCYAFDEFLKITDGKRIKLPEEDIRIHACQSTMKIILSCSSTVFVFNIEDGNCVDKTSHGVALCVWFYKYQGAATLGTVMDVKTDSQGNVYVCDLERKWGGIHQVSACSFKENKLLINNCKDVSSLAIDENRKRIIVCFRCGNRIRVYYYIT